MGWFRIHDSILDSRKHDNLPDATFRQWIYFAAIANRYNHETGELPLMEECAFLLRISEKKSQKLVEELVEYGLVDEKNGKYFIHDWSEWQYRTGYSPKGHSESLDRVRRFRSKKRAARSVTDEVTDQETVQPLPQPLPRARVFRTEQKAEDRIEPTPELSSSSESLIKLVQQQPETQNEKRLDPTTTTTEPKPEQNPDRIGLIEAIRQTTGIQPDRKLVQQIRDRLEVRGVNEAEFILDTVPRCGRNREKTGPGFWLSQAARFGETPPRERPPDPEKKPPICNLCQDTGRVRKDRDGIVLIYCSCQCGNVMKGVDELRAKRAAGKSDPPTGLQKVSFGQ